MIACSHEETRARSFRYQHLQKSSNIREFMSGCGTCLVGACMGYSTSGTNMKVGRRGTFHFKRVEQAKKKRSARDEM